MRVLNIHERALDATAEKVGLLIDGLGSANDLLWPVDRWPAMRLDRPLGVGAVGGHGPIRYCVESYSPGRSVQFRFIEPRGFAASTASRLSRRTTEGQFFVTSSKCERQDARGSAGRWRSVRCTTP